MVTEVSFLSRVGSQKSIFGNGMVDVKVGMGSCGVRLGISSPHIGLHRQLTTRKEWHIVVDHAGHLTAVGGLAGCPRPSATLITSVE